MGRAHAMAFAAAARTFDLGVEPVLEILADRDDAARGGSGAHARLRAFDRRLARGSERSGGRPGRDHHAQRAPRADRAGGDRGGQAGLLREAAGGDAGRCGGDDAGGGSGGAADRGRLHLSVQSDDLGRARRSCRAARSARSPHSAVSMPRISWRPPMRRSTGAASPATPAARWPISAAIASRWRGIWSARSRRSVGPAPHRAPRPRSGKPVRDR